MFLLTYLDQLIILLDSLSCKVSFEAAGEDMGEFHL